MHIVHLQHKLDALENTLQNIKLRVNIKWMLKATKGDTCCTTHNAILAHNMLRYYI